MLIVFQLVMLLVLLGVIAYMVLISYMVYRGCNYIPTPQKDVKSALTVLKPGDIFIDLGFGYGEVLEAALHAGAGKVIGYELDPFRFLQVWWKLRPYSAKVELHLTDIWTAKLDTADVVFTFFTILHTKRLYDKVKQEASKAKWFISYVHEVPGVKPTKVIGQVKFFEL